MFFRDLLNWFNVSDLYQIQSSHSCVVYSEVCISCSVVEADSLLSGRGCRG